MNPRNPHIKKKPSEFQEKVLEIKRVTRVVAGGKRMSFRATIVIGDKKGRVGLGIGKGLDVAASVEKAKRQAQKNLITVNLKDSRTIPHEIEEKYSAARIRLKPAKLNHGLIAGGSARTVLELAGVRDVSAKILGRTTNKLTNALATMNALRKLAKKAEPSTPETV
ncbi:30S ribosomal protein S5 [Patescibacteria group bacterium]|jgi:small subunit ribosomal protein S5|nr:30S ribosomal protein S5 [Patescibacteria group bacterium]MCL5114778.1 30S ribosomal protein S5 [Patescibacteria group bacterium]